MTTLLLITVLHYWTQRNDCDINVKTSNKYYQIHVRQSITILRFRFERVNNLEELNIEFKFENSKSFNYMEIKHSR